MIILKPLLEKKVSIEFIEIFDSQRIKRPIKNILADLKEVKIIEFDHNDVVRHPLISKIISAYQNKNINDQD